MSVKYFSSILTSSTLSGNLKLVWLEFVKLVFFVSFITILLPFNFNGFGVSSVWFFFEIVKTIFFVIDIHEYIDKLKKNICIYRGHN